jgi:hypothetical protein
MKKENLMKIYMSLFALIATPNVRVVNIYILGPEWLVLGNGKVKPGLIIPVVMNYRSVVDLSNVNSWIIAQAQDMPSTIQRVCQVVESN